MQVEEYQKIREKLHNRMQEDTPTSQEVTRKFLSYFFCDADGWEEAINHIRDFIDQRPKTIVEDLQGLQSFLKNPPSEKGILLNLVAWEANWVLEDPSDKGAREWLEKVAETVREILGDNAPPRP